MHTGEFTLPTPPGLPALAPGEAFSETPIPPDIPARTLGEAFSEAIREVAHEIGAYCPTDTGEAGVGIDRLPVARAEWFARLARELWKRGARLLK